MTIEWRWPNFSPEEVFPPGNLEWYMKFLNEDLMDRLELLKSDLGGVPIILNNWKWGGKRKHAVFRTRWQNMKVGGAKNSFHMMFRAADVSSPVATLEQLSEGMKNRFGGVIVYKNNGFVHGDTRYGKYFRD